MKPAVRLLVGDLLENSLKAVAGEKGAKDLQTIATGVSAALPEVASTALNPITLPPVLPPAANAAQPPV